MFEKSWKSVYFKVVNTICFLFCDWAFIAKPLFAITYHLFDADEGIVLADAMLESAQRGLRDKTIKSIEDSEKFYLFALRDPTLPLDEPTRQKWEKELRRIQDDLGVVRNGGTLDVYRMDLYKRPRR
jgi:hypothetical protein